MKIYLIEDVCNSPGKVYACMVHEEDAHSVARAIEHNLGTECEVVERTLFYGQPTVCGYSE